MTRHRAPAKPRQEVCVAAWRRARMLMAIALLLPAFVLQSHAQAPARLKAGAGIIIYPVRADKTAEFEALISKVSGLVQRSDNPVRRQQGQGWRVFRAQEPGPAGSVLYLSVLNPIVKLADYDVVAAAAEELSRDEAAQFNRIWKECLAGPPTVLDLQFTRQFAPDRQPKR